MKQNTRFRKMSAVLALVLVFTLALPWTAFADQVVNNIDTTIDPALETRTITAGGSTGVGFYIQPSNIIPPGDASGCNATGANPANVTLSVPAGVSALPTSLIFTGCGIVQNVTFSSSTVGSYNITVANVTGGKWGSLWSTAPAEFTLIVNPSADTTPPETTITLDPASPNGLNGWYVSNVHVTVSAADNPGGSGVAETRCVLDPVSAPASFDAISAGCDYTGAGDYVTTEGQHIVYAASRDNADNKESPVISKSFKIDKTAPTITFVGPATGVWYNADVTASWNCSDGLSGEVSASASATTSGEGAARPATGTCYDNAGNWASDTQYFKVDKTAPTITFVGPPTSPWYNADVTANWNYSDALSGVVSASVSDTTSGEGETIPATGTCYDNAGNWASDTQYFKVDKTPPTIVITSPAKDAAYTLNQAVASNFSCTDALSGLASCAGPVANGSNIDTGSVGSKTFTVNATDNAENSASLTHNYRVIYNWNGFFRPVDNLPTLNVAKAGSAIPVKFSLSGNQGLSIFAAGYPKWQVIACDTGALTDTIDETVTAGNSSLTYDPLADQYVYVWKTDKGWTGCRQLVVKLNDGMEYRANFKFK